MESLIFRLSEVTENDDVRFFVMKAMKQELGKTPIKVQTGLDQFVCVLCFGLFAVLFFLFFLLTFLGEGGG